MNIIDWGGANGVTRSYIFTNDIGMYYGITQSGVSRTLWTVYVDSGTAKKRRKRIIGGKVSSDLKSYRSFRDSHWSIAAVIRCFPLPTFVLLIIYSYCTVQWIAINQYNLRWACDVRVTYFLIGSRHSSLLAIRLPFCHSLYLFPRVQ